MREYSIWLEGPILYLIITIIPLIHWTEKCYKMPFRRAINSSLGPQSEWSKDAWHFCFQYAPLLSLCGVSMITSTGQHDNHSRPVWFTQPPPFFDSLKTNKQVIVLQYKSFWILGEPHNPHNPLDQWSQYSIVMMLTRIRDNYLLRNRLKVWRNDFCGQKGFFWTPFRFRTLAITNQDPVWHELLNDVSWLYLFWFYSLALNWYPELNAL